MGMVTDTIRGTVSDNIAVATKDWVGGDMAQGNLYARLYNLGMDIADELVAGKLGSTGTVMIETSKLDRAFWEAKRLGENDAGAMKAAIWKMAEEKVREQIVESGIKNLPLNEKNKLILGEAIQIAREILSK